MRRLKACLICLGCILSITAIGCGGSPAPPAAREPAIFLVPQFLWQKDAQRMQTSFPLTATNPGAVVQVKNAQHQHGFGATFQAADLYTAAEMNGQQFLASEIEHMKTSGWQQLFKPTASGSYPLYSLYVTFRAGSYYCFVEYTASRLDEAQGSQVMDIYYS